MALVAGLLDFGSGLGLLVLPSVTLRLMLVPVPAGDEALHLMRFVGVFVAAVGLSYLWGLAGSTARLRTVLELTRMFRLATGAFTLVSVLCGALAPGWLLVAVLDFLLLGAQTLGLRREECWK